MYKDHIIVVRAGYPKYDTISSDNSRVKPRSTVVYKSFAKLKELYAEENKEAYVGKKNGRVVTNERRILG